VEIPPFLTQLLARQENVVAMWQLPTPLRRAAARAVRRGHWRRLTKKTFLAAPTPPTQRQRAWAAALHGGSQARICGRNALVLLGWKDQLGTPYDIVVPHQVQPAPPPEWLRVHRVSLAVTGPAATPPHTSAHLATARAAAWASTDREATLIVISVLQQRLTEPGRLLNQLEKMPRLPRGQLIAEMVKEFSHGAHSLNELDFAALCQRYEVPLPQRQTKRLDSAGKLRAIDVEFVTPSGKVLRLEIEGIQHLNPDNYLADVTRHNRLQIADPAVGLRVLSWTLAHEPGPFMTELRGWVLEL
jgi:acyl transferase domain-containing protein